MLAKVRREPASHSSGNELRGCDSIDKNDGLDHIVARRWYGASSEQWLEGGKIVCGLYVADREVDVRPIIPQVKKEGVVDADSQGSSNFT